MIRTAPFQLKPSVVGLNQVRNVWILIFPLYSRRTALFQAIRNCPLPTNARDVAAPQQIQSQSQPQQIKGAVG